MSPSEKKSVTVTYRKRGTRPPVFLAGSYSDPAWTPQEMEHVDWEGLEGEHVFSKHILAEPGSQVQYKIRIGTGDWWVLNEDASTVLDDAGNWNNVIEVPPHHDTLSERPDAASKDKARAVDNDPEASGLATTPITARATFADSAGLLYVEQPNTQSHAPHHDHGTRGEHVPPLFPHECFGLYEATADEGIYEDDPDVGTVEKPKKRDSEDFNDPTLLQFPSSRGDIIDAMRKLGTGLSEDEGSFEGTRMSPVVGASRRTDVPDTTTPSLVPVNPRHARRLEPPRALSDHSSSVVSLQSISEVDDDDDDDDDDDEGLDAPFSLHGETPASDEDEGIAMKDDGKEAGHLPLAHEMAEQVPDASDNASTTGKGDQPTLSVQTSSASGAEIDKQGSPRIVVQPPDDSEGEQSQSETVLEAGAASTALDTAEGSTTQPRKRRVNGAAPQVTVTTAELQPAQGNENWVAAFFRVLFVRWIGRWISRLFGSRSKTLLAAGTATVLVGYAGWKVLGTQRW